MLLEEYIKNNFLSKQHFARHISTESRHISRQQVSKWANSGCLWIDGNVWRNASKLKQGDR